MELPAVKVNHQCIITMNTYVLLIALVVALGGFVFGVDSGQSLASLHASMAVL
jgi:hypothetical protein